MADVPPPPKAKPPGAGSRLNIAPPQIEKAPENLSAPTERLVDMNFKVPESMHRQFKATAGARGLSMRELLEESWSVWKSQNRAVNI